MEASPYRFLSFVYTFIVVRDHYQERRVMAIKDQTHYLKISYILCSNCAQTKKMGSLVKLGEKNIGNGLRFVAIVSRNMRISQN